MKKFIVVAGNIGVGKTTLVNLLSKELDYQPFLEPVAQNPYLADFYGNMDAWAFHSQIYFLTQRMKMHRTLVNLPYSIIQDRSVYEDAEIFARNLHLQGHLGERDFDTYCDLYHTLLDFLIHPDLIVYLRASVDTLQHRIALRNRSYEKSIPRDYLNQLNLLYEKWINEYTISPVLTIPADNMDFVARPDHLKLIYSKIQEKLTGKDLVVFTPEEIL